jgi:hypothetical protein
MKPTTVSPAILAAIITGLSTITGLDIGSSFNSVANAGLVIGATVALIRKAVPKIDGHYVIALSVVLGAIMYGASNYFFAPITVMPFASWPKGLAGMAFGAYAGAVTSGLIGMVKGFLPGAPVGLSESDLMPIGASDAQITAIDTDTSRARSL